MKTLNIVLTTKVSDKDAEKIMKEGIDISSLEAGLINKKNPKQQIKVKLAYFE